MCTRKNCSARTSPLKESLTVEFKSDQKRLSDNELVAAVVCLANTKGGHIYLSRPKSMSASIHGAYRPYKRAHRSAYMIERTHVRAISKH
jgi:hypothetical protein